VAHEEHAFDYFAGIGLALLLSAQSKNVLPWSGFSVL